MKDIYIVAAKRSALGSFGGTLSTLPAPKIAAQVISQTLESIKLNPDLVNEVLIGNVMSAGMGQAPARQAGMFAGIPNTVPATTINKVCSSGMKAVMIGAGTIALGSNDIVVAGGMENMSMVPHLLPQGRTGTKLGNLTLIDGLVHDGLTDVYNNYHMGNAAELCAKECNISRDEQDNFAIESYKRATKAWSEGKFNDEIVPVSIPQRRGDDLVFDRDEEFTNVKFEKIPALRPVFQKEGTVTAANASTLNDGAAVIILASEEAVHKHQLTPIAKIKGFADAAQAPEWFTTAPAKAIPKAIAHAGLEQKDISYYEINEAFSVVSLANMMELEVEPSQVNVNGGAVSLGHPLGCSGARIIVTLIQVLKQNGGKYGVAGICNGGGGASAIVIENI